MFEIDDNSQNADRYKPEKINYRLPDGVRPTHYNIKLTLSFSKFDGETCIDLVVRKSTFDITLHCDQIIINETTTLLINTKNEHFKPIEQIYVKEKELFVLRFQNVIEPDCYKLHFTFKGLLEDTSHGFNRRFYTDEKQGTCTRYVVTNFKTTFARRVFPCFDEPNMKATFTISIKHPKLYVALSNMPIKEQSSIDEKGYLWTHFEKTPIMSTYLLGIVLLPNDSKRFSNLDGTINVWCRQNWHNVVKLIHEVTEDIKLQLEHYTGIINLIPKIDHVMIPNHSKRCTENWGLIVYDEDDITYVEDPTDTYNLEMITRLVAHNLVQQWFENLVGPTWWNYLWLNESLAHYFKYYFINQAYPEWRVLEMFVVVVQQTITLYRDNCSFIRHKPYKGICQEPYLGVPAIIYHKGSCILRMLSHCLSEPIFHKGILKYLKTFQYETSMPDQLWKIFEDMMNLEKFNIKEIMDTWLNQKGYPLVTAKRDLNTGMIIVTQKRFKLSDIDHDKDEESDDDDNDNEDDDDDYDDDDKADDVKWWIPINYTSKSEVNFSSTLPTHWLKPQDENLTIDNIDPNDWFVFNVQQTGYYRVNYDEDNWNKIAEYLNTENYTNIHPLNRAQIIDDSSYMVRTKRLNPIVFLEIMNYLWRETDYIPWYSAFKVFDTFQDYFKFPESSAFFKSYVLRLIDGLLQNVGYDETPYDDHLTKLKRIEVLELASKLGHLECKKIANAKLIKHLKNPHSNPIPTNLKPWVFNTGMKEANEILFNKCLQIYKCDPSFINLNNLTGVENPILVEQLLNLTLTNDSPILKDHRVDVYRRLMYTSVENVNVTIDFIINNWEKINSRIEDSHEIIETVIDEITSWDQFHKVKHFMKANGLKQSTKDVEKNLKKAKKHLSKVLRWIKMQNCLKSIDEQFENLHLTDVTKK
ncbi:PREDICTED: aminopeptidase N-like [Polistes dominula]|uniref:Aminopeptidase n=1 Tax=Polistes dominula TaxID=743375 RepID=A0ABM1IWL1_POLDO|nr:PREDICTED: aminopeptidase N-like [Polistes dominula]